MMRGRARVAAAAARRRRDRRHAVLVRGARARLGPHGSRQRAVRDRAVVSAHGRVRRRARLEHRSLSRPGRVLPRVRQHRLFRHRSGRVRRRRQRRAPESRRGADARRRSIVSTARRDRRRSCRSSPRTRPPRRAVKPVRGRRRGGSAPSTCATSRGRRRRTSAGTPPAGTASSRRRCISFRKPDAPGSRPPSRRNGPFARTPGLWMRYPYPQATTVAGPVHGMEYPMFVMAGYGGADPASIVRHDRSRAGPRVVPDDRRVERASLRVDGRGLQHVSERVLQRAARRRERRVSSRTWRVGARPSTTDDKRRS